MARGSVRRAAVAKGRRSGFECEVEALLPPGTTYETTTYNWWEKRVQVQCSDCGMKNIVSKRRYTPDFFLPNGIILEVKGRFTAKDRKIAQGMQNDHPELDIRYVLQYNNKLTKTSKQRDGDWLDKHGLDWTTKTDMKEVLHEWSRCIRAE